MGDMYVWCGGNGAFEGAIVCESICCFVTYYTSVCLDFLYGDFVRKPCDVVYYGSNEKFVWVVVLG